MPQRNFPKRVKAGIITQARMTSTRLPGKVLKQIKGVSLLKYHSDRVKESGYPFYIATTTNSTDDDIVDFCKEENIAFYRGDEANVLSRYFFCAKENKLDIIVRVTSDCPLVDGLLIKRALNQYVNQFEKYDYVSNYIERTFPRGFDFEIFSFEYLEEAYLNATMKEELEHVTPYINLNRSNKTIFHSILYKEDKSNYRITVDTQEDFELIRRLIVDHCANELSASEIIAILDNNPDLVKINAHIQQKNL